MLKHESILTSDNSNSNKRNSLPKRKVSFSSDSDVNNANQLDNIELLNKKINNNKNNNNNNNNENKQQATFYKTDQPKRNTNTNNTNNNNNNNTKIKTVISNHIKYASFCSIFWCWYFPITGVIAIFYAFLAKRALNSNNLTNARRYLKLSELCFIATICIGMTITAIVILYYRIYVY
jgi:hypothetical protein